MDGMFSKVFPDRPGWRSMACMLLLFNSIMSDQNASRSLMDSFFKLLYVLLRAASERVKAWSVSDFELKLLPPECGNIALIYDSCMLFGNGRS